MTEKKKIEMKVFDILQGFSLGNKELNKVWIEPKKILCSESKIRSLMIESDEPMFATEFGLNDLVKFTSMLGLFDEVKMDINETNIVLTEKEGRRRMVYGTSKNSAFQPIRDKDGKAEHLHMISREMEGDGKYLEFALSHDLIQQISKAGSILSKGSASDSLLTIAKQADSEKILLTVTNEGSNADNFTTFVDCQNAGKLEEFNHTIKVKYLLNGDWKFYVFPDEKVKHLGQDIKPVWCHLVNEKEKLSLILIYKNN